MELEERIKAFSTLGNKLSQWLNEINLGQASDLDTPLVNAFYANGWFEKEQSVFALTQIAQWLNQENLSNWMDGYRPFASLSPQWIGVIMAGNIPLVGYHDYLSVLIVGHKLRAKLSRKDKVLIQFLHDELIKIESRFSECVDFSDVRFTDVAAIIATGSDNSARYFEYYFSKIPRIIRKNRTSIAVLTGSETAMELNKLGNDIFRYYGLGCRNVTKIFLPEDFDIHWFYEGILPHHGVIENHKYKNNYTYYKSIYLLNGDKLWDNHFLLIKRDTGLYSPIGTLFYDTYKSDAQMKEITQGISGQIQCNVGIQGVKLGETQRPKLTDYPDNIDVIAFLIII